MPSPSGPITGERLSPSEVLLRQDEGTYRYSARLVPTLEFLARARHPRNTTRREWRTMWVQGERVGPYSLVPGLIRAAKHVLEGQPP